MRFSELKDAPVICSRCLFAALSGAYRDYADGVPWVKWEEDEVVAVAPV